MSAETIYYTVYRTTNLINNKEYIGVHVTDNPNDWYMGSGVAIKRAIKKHGSENFKKEVLFIFDNEDDMFAKERELVNEDYIKRDDVYNMIVGGIGSHSRYTRGEEHFMYGRKHSEETKQKLREVAKHNRTEEYRRRASLAKQNVSEETRRKITEANTGRKHSQETKENMKVAAKKRMESEETRKKISESVKNLPRYECPHCKRWLQITALKQFHLDKCKKNPDRVIEEPKTRTFPPKSQETKDKLSKAIKNQPKYECPHCKNYYPMGHLKRWHLDNCKYKTDYIKEGA